MKKTYRLFNVPVFSILYEGFDDLSFIRNTGGSFDPEDDANLPGSFGFQGRPS